MGVVEGGILYVRQDYGLTEKIDVGLTGEAVGNGVVGLRGKYTFKDRPEGFSLAALGGIGAGRVTNDAVVGDLTTTGYYGYLGAIVSYKWERLETYFVPRYNYIYYKDEITVDAQDESGLDLPDYSTTYGSFTLGGSWWFTPGLGLTTNVSILLVEDGSFSEPGFALGLAFSY